MAEYRTIHTRIWEDEYFAPLSDKGKILFIYLFTNHRASVSGIYRLPYKHIPFETGLSRVAVNNLLALFRQDKKVFYEDGIVWVVNMRKYQDTGSSKLKIKIDSDIAAIPDCPLKQRYLTADTKDTVSGVENTVSEVVDTQSTRYGNGNGNGNGNEPVTKRKRSASPPACGWCANPTDEPGTIRAVMQSYHDRFKAKTGECPIITNADFGKLDGLRKKGLTFEALLLCMDRWFDDLIAFAADCTYSIGGFITCINQLKVGGSHGRNRQGCAKSKHEREYIEDLEAQERAGGG